jgi:histidinol-phosphatase (PHP family)
MNLIEFCVEHVSKLNNYQLTGLPLFWANYHTHSLYSDGSNKPEVMIKSAIGKRIKILGFSDHAPIPFDSGWNMKNENIENYINDINELKTKYASEIEIYTGLEIDYISSISGIKNWKHLNLDYTIGSVHFLKKFETGNYFNFDYSREIFAKGLKKIFGNNIKKMVSYYYEQIINMINEDKPDIIGHLDLITKFNKKNYFFNESDKWYKDIVNLTLSVIKEKDCIVEINTRGFYKNLSNNYYPNYWILQNCKLQNIPVLINSDSHNYKELSNQLPEVALQLIEIGFKDVMIYQKNTWNKVGLYSSGLNF